MNQVKECVISVDIGASSGRVMVSYFDNNQLKIEEIHRFPNNFEKKGQHICWDLNRLFQEILKGMKKVKELGWYPQSIGIDTWAVDFVLLDSKGNRLGEAISYRDSHVDGMLEEVTSIISKEKIYERTGIQFLKFNTVYQLYSLKKKYPDMYENAETFLMIPDYFHYLLTGKMVNEYTNATTTQLVSIYKREWDDELIELLGLKREIFQPIVKPGTSLGTLRKEIVEWIGYDVEVIIPATHDTASAVIAMPANHDAIYLSSGTWSLIGIENEVPFCNPLSLKYNFTNEGGIQSRYRFLKNIMGLWMIQEVRREIGNSYTFEQLTKLAEKQKIKSLVNVDDERFLNPKNMIKEIREYCKETQQAIPRSVGEVVKVIYSSLALSYREAIQKIEQVTGKEFDIIHIIGGGSQNDMLNRQIVDVIQKEVIAGPSEATALGNSIVQWIALGYLEDLKEARKLVRNSIPLKIYRKCEEFINDSTN
ncbi:MAG TPA: rhamnulokinase [Erysipelothrix sp.]